MVRFSIPDAPDASDVWNADVEYPLAERHRVAALLISWCDRRGLHPLLAQTIAERLRQSTGVAGLLHDPIGLLRAVDFLDDRQVGAAAAYYDGYAANAACWHIQSKAEWSDQMREPGPKWREQSQQFRLLTHQLSTVEFHALREALIFNRLPLELTVDRRCDGYLADDLASGLAKFLPEPEAA